jgi:hypothetical protein
MFALPLLLWLIVLMMVMVLWPLLHIVAHTK